MKKMTGALGNKEIIRGVIKRDASVIKYLYNTCYPDIRNLVLANTGTIQDAQDLFQDALLIIYRKIKTLNLTLNCAFKTYLYSVCRLMWLKELESRRNQGKNYGYVDPHSTSITEEVSSLEVIKLRIYEKHFGELSKECQDILKMYFNGMPMEEICNRMGFQSVHAVKEKKYECKKSLMTKIHNNPAYKQLQDEIYLVS
jgi:RNA polymerase sigma factor (sigma-70 family)